MKKSQFLAALALIMALGLAAPTILSASAEEGQPAEETTTSIERVVPEGTVAPTSLDDVEEDVATPTADENISVVSASTLDELQTALSETADTILISGTITITEDTTLDLKGKTLKLADDLYRMFAVQEGNVTIKNGTLRSNDSTTQTGNAILWVTGSDADAGFENHTTLTVENDVKIITGNSYGLAVHYLSDKQLARGVTINFAGTIDAPYGISVNGNIQDTENAPVLNISGTVTSTEDLAIFAAGYAEWNLNGATLTGATPLGLKAGKFTLENSTLNATGEYKKLNATGSGMNPNGAVFQIENSRPYAGEIDITVKSGDYESAHGPVFSEYGSTVARTAGSNLKSLSISGGTFKSAEDQPIFENVAVAETVITGGNFNNDEGLEDYLKTDQELVKDENGNFVIQTVNTPVNPDKPADKDDKPTTKPDDKNPDGSLPNTGIIASIEHAANAVGALGTTVITGVLVASGAAIAWFIGSRRRKATARSGKSSKSSKSGRNFRIDRVEVEISAAPRATAKSARSSAKASQTASKSVSASAKPTSKASKPASKTTKKLPAKSAKTSKKASSSAKSASSRKSAVSSRSAAKSAKKRS